MSNNDGTDANGSASKGRYERHHVNEQVCIYKQPSKSPNWYLDYWIDGHQHRPSTKTKNKKLAIELANRKYKEIVLGIAAVQSRVRVRCGEAIDRFLQNRKEKRNTEESTLDSYRSNLNDFANYLASAGVTWMDQIRLMHLEGFEQYLREKAKAAELAERKACKAKRPKNRTGTLHNKLMNMRQLVKFAVDKGWIERDPTRGFEMPRRVHVQAYCWTKEEQTALVQHTPPTRKDEINFLRLTGLRAGEFSWLNKHDVDLASGLIRICKKVAPDGTVLWKPKTGDGRVVPLCSEALEIARRRLKTDDTPWLFSRPAKGGGRQQVSKGQLRHVVKTTMKKAGVERGTTHTWRHAFCAFIANNGVPPLIAMKIMGHRSLNIILIYYHIEEQDMSRVFGAVRFENMLHEQADESGLIRNPQAA